MDEKTRPFSKSMYLFWGVMGPVALAAGDQFDQLGLVIASPIVLIGLWMWLGFVETVFGNQNATEKLGTFGMLFGCISYIMALAWAKVTF